MNFDFDSVPTKEEAVWFTVLHPVTGEDLYRDGDPVRLAILGPDTPKMKAHENKIQDKRFDAIQRTGDVKMNSDLVERESLARAMVSIVGWENFAKGGVALEFNPSNLKELLEGNPWLMRFWEVRYRNAGNFLGTGGSTEKS